MAVKDINVSGPYAIAVSSALGNPDSAEAQDVLGYTREGPRLRLIHAYDDPRADNLGGQTLQEGILIGKRVQFELELHKVDRDLLEDFAWLYGPSGDTGEIARIGRQISDLDGSGNTIQMSWISQIGARDYRFKAVAPRRIVQQLGNAHSIIRIEGDAILAGTSPEFFDNTAVSSQSDSSLTEVVGAHKIVVGGTDVGYTREGIELTIEVFYNEARNDADGRETDADLVVDGYGVTLRMEIHSGTQAEIDNIATAFRTDANYGLLDGIGVKQAGSLVAVLLDSELETNGKDWTFDAMIVENQVSEEFGNRNRRTQVEMRALPLGAGNRFYSIATGA